MNISVTDARSLFTQKLIDVYKERIKPTGFLRSFFPETISDTKEISIEVQRGTEEIAVDVERGTRGNRNSFNKSTQKIFVPPYFREYFDATDLDLYDRMFGTADMDIDIFTAFLESVADKLRILQDTIERAYEVACAQVLQTGIVTLNKGININFKRKAESLVNINTSTGSYWSTAGHDVFKDFENGGDFIRQKGKVQGGMINAICGRDALSTLIANDVFVKRQNLFHMSLDQVMEPQRNSVGATLHGRITAGSYKVNLWAYPEYYDNAAGVSTPYIDPSLVILLPEQPRFKMAYAAVPRLLKTGGIGAVKGAYVIGEYLDEQNTAHIMDIKSAGVPVPVAVDQIYTMKVIA